MTPTDLIEDIRAHEANVEAHWHLVSGLADCLRAFTPELPGLGPAKPLSLPTVEEIEARRWERRLDCEARQLFEEYAAASPEARALLRRREELEERLRTTLTAHPVALLSPVPGLAPCPACKAPCLEVPREVFEKTNPGIGCLAVCTRDPNHRVEWLPWGG